MNYPSLKGQVVHTSPPFDSNQRKNFFSFPKFLVETAQTFRKPAHQIGFLLSGYSEAIFAATHLLGFSYVPRIKNLKKQSLYIFKSRKNMDQSNYKIIPDKYVIMVRGVSLAGLRRNRCHTPITRK